MSIKIYFNLFFVQAEKKKKNPDARLKTLSSSQAAVARLKIQPKAVLLQPFFPVTGIRKNGGHCALE
ncbi:MAG TPA: hypothetical protein PLZ01_16050, partial [bacterium]|nr:hypothetical protein [bacterium]